MKPNPERALLRRSVILTGQRRYAEAMRCLNEVQRRRDRRDAESLSHTAKFPKPQPAKEKVKT